jgi:hypothetical protein
MSALRHIYWQDGPFWLGDLEKYPDYLTQGESHEDLQDYLRDLLVDLTSGDSRDPAGRRTSAAGERMPHRYR